MENEYKLEPQDKISMNNTAKGLLQAEVRIGGKMDSNEAIDEVIRRQKYAWDKLKMEFKNLIWSNEKENEENK